MPPAPAVRIGLGEAISAASALLLLICMFALRWFGTVGLPGRLTGAGLLSAEDAWNGMTILRWAMLASIAVALGGLALHVSQSGHGAKTNTGALTLAVAGPTAVLVAVRVLIDLPSPATVVDRKLGGYLGVLLSLGLALGAWRTLQEERAARREAHARR